MQFDMLEGGTMTPPEFPNRADLVYYIVDQLGRVSFDIAPAESLQIIISGVCAQTDTVLLRQLDHPIHGIRIARMKACGYVCRTNDLHDLCIRRIAQNPLTKPLAHIAIEIYCFFHAFTLVLLWPQPAHLQAKLIFLFFTQALS
jgi:hypothetical protein